ncbi:MAG: hypothetical protein M9955_13200 [Rhizobiaceae bacterium]|nr:hypothetical protein [Rhizobiaceae bacterium]
MDMPVSPDEWRVFGPRLIDEYTKLTHDAVRDPGKVSDLMATLVNIAGRPRDDARPDHEAGVEVFDMVCTAHAVLSAAELYGDEPEERAMARWLRSMAMSYLFIVASQIGHMAARAVKGDDRPETLH